MVGGDIEFALRKIDTEEWGVFLDFRRKQDDGAAEAMLRRAVVGLDAEDTRSEKARMELVLDEDPQLGDFWGLQLLEAAGLQALVQIEDLGEGSYQLTATVGQDHVGAHLRRLTRAQWKEVRRAVARDHADTADLLAFRLAGGDPGAYPLRPALPYLFGHLTQGLGTKAGALPKSFPG